MRNMTRYEMIVDSQLKVIEKLNSGETSKAIQDETISQANQAGKLNKFYGHRLRLLRAFYGLSIPSLASLINQRRDYISDVELNKVKPIDIEVRIFAIYFNVEEAVFRDEQVYITITEQNKLKIM